MRNVFPVSYGLYLWFSLRHPVPGGCEYGNLTLEFGGISDQTVKYGYGF
jgi:hypothetical protein